RLDVHLLPRLWRESDGDRRAPPVPLASKPIAFADRPDGRGGVNEFATNPGCKFDACRRSAQIAFLQRVTAAPAGRFRGRIVAMPHQMMRRRMRGLSAVRLTRCVDPASAAAAWPAGDR